MTHAEIIEREFRKFFPVGKITVDFTVAEIITVEVEDVGTFVCEATSDDDDFYFEDPNTGENIRFDFPEDWA